MSRDEKESQRDVGTRESSAPSLILLRGSKKVKFSNDYTSLKRFSYFDRTGARVAYKAGRSPGKKSLDEARCTVKESKVAETKLAVFVE